MSLQRTKSCAPGGLKRTGSLPAGSAPVPPEALAPVPPEALAPVPPKAIASFASAPVPALDPSSSDQASVPISLNRACSTPQTPSSF